MELKKKKIDVCVYRLSATDRSISFEEMMMMGLSYIYIFLFPPPHPMCKGGVHLYITQVYTGHAYKRD